MFDALAANLTTLLKEGRAYGQNATTQRKVPKAEITLRYRDASVINVKQYSFAARTDAMIDVTFSGQKLYSATIHPSFPSRFCTF